MTGPRPGRVLTMREMVSLTLRRRRRGAGFWFGLAIELLWPFVMAGIRIGWRGGEHVPRTGGALLAINHVSFADPIFDTAFVLSHGRIPRYLAKSELWSTPVVRSVLDGGGHIPVHRGSVRAGDAYRGAIEALRRGELVVFYPEATYTRDPGGWPMKAMNGIARIALVTGVPVIPVANWGTQDVLPPGSRKPRLWPRRRVTVVAGPPVDLSEFAGKSRTRTNLDRATATIMAEITALVAQVRGEQPPADGVPGTDPPPDAAAGPAPRQGHDTDLQRERPAS
ncbi:lysophospholipid acyltransferase family protein [Pseudonocardia asaccharolytica]|uniref:1-acyl-sn-glycerol-3-phosphate acyltransferase n=2 Tax=Pseudonocardia asaccharolytica TaxID=54010 RepID=A0A511CZ37_9PSEU|nr:lysophospholipid acyltransferase family protein [Pseudonocardia asaccharolytica]GEL17810.1 1-acyl-sn-glycerol-3-phosphate acyltransferase [Pseudonocardia asaccharolytica DSM 44247 = NBRC 16224]